MLGMAPLWANVAAFCTAVMVGFVGHFFWTFRDHGVAEMGRWKAALPRFIVVSLIGLGLNSVSIYMVVNVLSMSYWYAVSSDGYSSTDLYVRAEQVLGVQLSDTFLGGPSKILQGQQ